MRQLRSLDLAHGWEDGCAARAVIQWIAPPGPRLAVCRDGLYGEFWLDDAYDWRVNDEDPRTVIETVFGGLGKNARRELRNLVVEADERERTRRLVNPFAQADLPWWLRSIA
jgi:hypothetical protein